MLAGSVGGVHSARRQLYRYATGICKKYDYATGPAGRAKPSERRYHSLTGGAFQEQTRRERRVVNSIMWIRQLRKKVEAYFLQLFGWEIGDYSN
jgi:hypothetical protein